MKKVLVVGGGFFGLYLSEFLSQKGYSVSLIERESDFMQRASFVNQARVHNGYHYPRSVLTALRSRISFPRFVSEFEESIESDFDKYYIIGRALSKVTASQFKNFCDRIGLPCAEDTSLLKGMLNKSLVEAAFVTKEFAFDSVKLKNTMKNRVDEASVKTFLNAELVSVKDKIGKVEASIKYSDGIVEKECFEHVFNCTYSGINLINQNSKLDLVPLRHEMTEMCLVDVPDELKKVGITVMCGPFFSVMPFPSKKLHSFSHVRYTPHYEWSEDKSNFVDSYNKFQNDIRNSSWKHMILDARRYIPALEECTYRESIWDVKTILPRSDADDSRPILYLPNHKINGYHCIMGGKIDNVYDVIESISKSNLIG